MDSGLSLAREYGNLLRDIREGTKLSVTGMAKMMGASAAWLSYVERGERVPSWPFIQNCLETLEKQRDVAPVMLQRLHEAGKRLVLQKVFSGDDEAPAYPSSKILRHRGTSSVQMP